MIYNKGWCSLKPLVTLHLRKKEAGFAPEPVWMQKRKISHPCHGQKHDSSVFQPKA
jgi:hypothetical protein